jgi:hypothetical protein
VREHLCVVRTMHACWCLPGVLVRSSKSGLYYATLQASGVCATRTLCPGLSRARVGGCAPNNGAVSNSGAPGGSCSRLARRFVGPARLGRAVLGRATGVGHAAGAFLTEPAGWGAVLCARGARVRVVVVLCAEAGTQL